MKLTIEFEDDVWGDMVIIADDWANQRINAGGNEFPVYESDEDVVTRWLASMIGDSVTHKRRKDAGNTVPPAKVVK